MIVLSGKEISKSYGTDIIFEDVCFGVEKGDRIGIVGPNGTGKTTLLSIIAGELEPSSGEIYKRADLSIGYLKQQNHFGGSGSVIEEAQKSFKHLQETEARLEELTLAVSDHEAPDFEKNLAEYTNLMEEFERLGGYTYKSELSAMLVNMGFDEEAQGKELAKLSGGERTRLALCCLLLRKPDILMMDEPTNHLDLRMLAWIESYLDAYKGTLLVVSHDRYFLDKITNRIFDMTYGTLDAYEGNYSEFLKKRGELLEARLREYEKQQAEIARQEEMIRRFKQHGTEHLAKRARSREKRLAMMKPVERPKIVSSKMKLNLEADYKSGSEILETEGIAKSFGSRKLFENINLLVRKGERICIIGENGIGKTTLLKILMGLEEADEGYLRTGYNVSFGYYDQGQMMLDESETVLGEMKNAYHLYTDTEMRSLLGRFLFVGDDVFKLVGDLSGGEKAKLSLLKLMLSGANTLVLDEPTNHLDIESREIVEEALKEFDGTLIIVSHDRYLLNVIPDRILELERGGLTEYRGKFDYYVEKKASMEAEASRYEKAMEAEKHQDKAGDMPMSAEQQRKAQKQAEAEERRRSRRLESLESQIAELENEKDELAAELTERGAETDLDRIREVSERLAAIEDELSAVYDEWLSLQQ